MSQNPYRALDERAFWATAVAGRDHSEIKDLWTPKWRVARKHRIVTFGSCFAQHFSRALEARGFEWLNSEPAPGDMSEDEAKANQYGVFSARTGNIYTVSLLKQWMEWGLGLKPVPGEVWEQDGRFFDPFRPAIKKGGFACADEMLASRAATLDAFGRAMREADLLVFTLGLTESWFNRTHGYEYPMCPGTAAGTFDETEHVFVNQSFMDIRSRLLECLKMLREVNPKVRVLLTVSPVPLTATMSGDHVLVATTRSKSILRAVAADVMEERRFVDYFPSYEIVATAPFEGALYQKNKRTITPDGVSRVMTAFFEAQREAFGPASAKAGKKAGAAAKRAADGKGKPAARKKAEDDDDVVCEEELLAGFAKHPR